jgi:hypothetical protein
MGWLKRRLPKKRWKRAALYAGSTLLVAAAADMGLVQYWRGIDVSPETTRLVTPLTALGTPDYIAALNEKYGAGVTQENNAASLLLKARGRARAGTSASGKSDVPAGVVVNFARWVYETGQQGGFASETEIYDQDDLMQHVPWKGAEHPMWVRWLGSQAEGLADARRAAERPKLFVPLGPRQEQPGDLGTIMKIGVVGNQDAALREFRVIGYVLVSEGMRRLGEGDVAGFWEDTVAALKLARLVGDGPTIAHLLLGEAMAANAMRSVRAAALAQGVLSAEECRKMLADMEGLAPMGGLADRVDCEVRWEVLDNLSAIAFVGMGEYDARHRRDEDRSIWGFEMPAWCFKVPYLFVPVHFNEQMRQANRMVDEHVAALRLPTYAGRKAALEALSRRYDRRVNLITDRGHVYYEAYVRLGRADVLTQKNGTEWDLARLVLALAAYHGERGEYPEKLEGLKTAGILREVPLDRFSDQPLVYEQRGGGYVLYSVGDKMFGDNGEGEVQQGRGGYAWRVVRVE